MADTPLTAAQNAYLFLLMAEAREVSNSELQQRYGISITGVDSAALVDNKLATVRKDRSLLHELTDDGWAEAKKIMAGGYVKPSGASPASATLHAVLAALHRYMQRSQSSAADIFAATTPPTPTSATTKPKSSSRKPKAGEPVNVQARIRNAYKRLRRDPIIWVGLAELRADLDYISTPDVDQALQQLLEKKKIRLIPEENQKTITSADQDAAIVVSGEPKHLIAFGA
ncbi:MAG TPA: hypothetical protein DGG94_07425 [Micromonosporaceae bacterium]|nr:hypothetical protein [Micromonosporaceae bacterium]